MTAGGGLFAIRFHFHGNLPFFIRPKCGAGFVLRQLRENLSGIIAPFTRCLRCNGLLGAVLKAEIVEQLQPLTEIYYQAFRRCHQCGQIYWSGSHFEKLQKRVERLRSGTIK